MTATIIRPSKFAPRRAVRIGPQWRIIVPIDSDEEVAWLYKDGTRSPWHKPRVRHGILNMPPAAVGMARRPAKRARKA